MRSAPPPIDALLGDDARPERLAVAALYAIALGTLAGWLAGSLLTLTGHSLAALAVVAASAMSATALGAVVGWRIWRPPSGSLRWNGRVWTLDNVVGSVEIRLDSGNWMLLRFQSPGVRSLWFGLHAADQGSRWHGLRVALLHARKHAGSSAIAAASSNDNAGSAS
jgi:hypothetical protein